MKLRKIIHFKIVLGSFKLSNGNCLAVLKQSEWLFEMITVKVFFFFYVFGALMFKLCI